MTEWLPLSPRLSGDATEELFISTVRLPAVESVNIYKKGSTESKIWKYQVSADTVLAQGYEKAPFWS